MYELLVGTCEAFNPDNPYGEILAFHFAEWDEMTAFMKMCHEHYCMDGDNIVFKIIGAKE